MPHFSNHSLTQLDTCDTRLIELAFEAIEHVDFRVMEGERGEARQNEMADAGASHLRWPHSSHNCPEPGQRSRAFDFAPWPLDWKDEERFIHVAGFMRGLAARMGIPILWLPDPDGVFRLTGFRDLGHIQLRED
jgi:hypothetical protein